MLAGRSGHARTNGIWPRPITVRAEDDPHDLAKPRGKQDWMLEPHSIWYPRTTGIWQTVWLECVPATAIADLRWRSNLEEWELSLDAYIDGEERSDLRLQVRLHVGDLLLADDRQRAERATCGGYRRSLRADRRWCRLWRLRDLR